MTKRYRFPGVNSFGKNDVAIFKGRDIDARNIFTQLMLFKTLVLHSESGTGKSSIIQAGLLPLLEKSDSGYMPVIINLNDIVIGDSDSVLTDHTINKMLAANPGIENETLELFDHKTRSLWVLAKKLEKRGKNLLLIFDQFETFQSFSTGQIKKFKEELLKLLNNKIPPEVYEEIQKNIAGFNLTHTTDEKYEEVNKNYKFLSGAINAKTLFVIREDKLGTMSLLSDYFPDILKNDFILPSLTKENAYRALIEPAGAEGDFASPPFSFEDENDARELINVIADDQTKLVDPMQLQIAASSIERNVVIRNNKTIITKADIPEIVDIINAYYKGCWERVNAKLNERETIFPPVEFEKKRRSVITKLIVKDRRNLVHANLLIDAITKMADKSFIDELLAEGLIRKIPSGLDTFYQLCHDRFIKPVTDDIALFEEKENTRLKQLESEKIQQEMEAERQKQEQEIERQKKQIEEVEKARKQATDAQEEALNALIDREETLKKLNATNVKLKKYRKYITAAAVVVLIISLITLWNAQKSRDLARINIANRLITEAKAAYANEKHDIAFRKLLEAVQVQKSDSAQTLIDSLTFYEISSTRISVSNKNKDVIASIYPDKSATIWNIKEKRFKRIKDLYDVSAIRISNSGKYIACSNASNDYLRILYIDANNETHLVRDSIIISDTKKADVDPESKFEFDLNSFYSFQFSPKEDYAYYRLRDFSIKLINLDDNNNKKTSYTRLLEQIKPQQQDTVLWLDFSFDENVVGIFRQRSQLAIFNLPENKYLYRSIKSDGVFFHDSLPILYSLKNLDMENVLIEIINYPGKKQTKIKFEQLSSIQLAQSSLFRDFSIIVYRVNDSLFKILNTTNGKSTNIKIYNGEVARMITLSDHSKFWFYNGRDSLFELNKTDLVTNTGFGLNAIPGNFINWGNDNTIAYSENNFLFVHDIRTNKIDSFLYKNTTLEDKAGRYILAKTKKDEKASLNYEKMILIKPQHLIGKDKIQYFDSVYPLPPSGIKPTAY